MAGGMAVSDYDGRSPEPPYETEDDQEARITQLEAALRELCAVVSNSIGAHGHSMPAAVRDQLSAEYFSSKKILDALRQLAEPKGDKR